MYTFMSFECTQSYNLLYYEDRVFLSLPQIFSCFLQSIPYSTHIPECDIESYSIYTLLSLTFYIQHNAFEIHPYCCICYSFVPCYC